MTAFNLLPQFTDRFTSFVVRWTNSITTSPQSVKGNPDIIVARTTTIAVIIFSTKAARTRSRTPCRIGPNSKGVTKSDEFMSWFRIRVSSSEGNGKIWPPSVVSTSICIQTFQGQFRLWIHLQLLFVGAEERDDVIFERDILAASHG